MKPSFSFVFNAAHCVTCYFCFSVDDGGNSQLYVTPVLFILVYTEHDLR